MVNWEWKLLGSSDAVYVERNLCSPIIIFYSRFTIRYITQLSTQLHNFIILGNTATNQNNCI